MESILIFFIVLLLMTMPMSQIISAEINEDVFDSVINNNPITAINGEKLDGHFFIRGFIFGTYEFLDYVGFWGIKVYNPSEECTINAMGWHSYEPHYEFIKGYWLHGGGFIGYCNNGRVIGFVFGSLTVED